jgi:large repetitive protein
VPLDASGTATFNISTLTPGSHAITATYDGGAAFLGVQSPFYSETVTQTGTNVAVVQNSVFRKKKLKPIRLTAEITPSVPGGGIPSGEVTFELVKKVKKKVKVTTLGTAAVSGGAATVMVPANKVLNKAIAIVYSGDANDKTNSLTTPKIK